MRSFLACALALSVMACGEGTTPGATTTSATSGSTRTTGGGGAGGAPAAFPAPIVAGTPETDALAHKPESCGQPHFTWVEDAGLGKITSHHEKKAYTQTTLTALAAIAGIELPVPLQYDVDTHVVTYVTQDRGKTLEASAIIAWPTTVPDTADPLPTLVILHGTSGFTDGCGPSSDDSSYTLAAALASTGHIVVVPDYIGMKNGPPPSGFLHPYLVGQATAIASLDAVRTLGGLPAEIRQGGARPSPKVVILGGSQGGHAALWLDRLAPYYARELEIVGVTATVPPADMLTEGTLALQGFRAASANMVAFFGASAGWYDAASKLSEVFASPWDTQVPAALATGCDPGAAFSGITALDQVFQKSILDAAAANQLGSISPWGCMTAENGLTTTHVARIQKDPASFGILFITGEDDTLVDTPTERATFKALCEGGMPMKYLECAGASHTLATSWALPEIIGFLSDRVAGKPFTKSCEVTAPVTCAGTPKP